MRISDKIAISTTSTCRTQQLTNIFANEQRISHRKQQIFPEPIISINLGIDETCQRAKFQYSPTLYNNKYCQAHKKNQETLQTEVKLTHLNFFQTPISYSTFKYFKKSQLKPSSSFAPFTA